jgi:hypothetical protein
MACVSTCDDTPNPPEIEALYPEGSTPEPRLDKVSALCSYGMRPHVMTGLLRQLLLAHFSDPENIEEPRVRRQLEQIGMWRPSDNGLNAGGILIESITRWQPATADKRPAILLRRNGWRWQRQGIGDKAQTNAYEGSTHYAGLWEGSHTLFCLCPSGAETELLATEVVKFLHSFAPWIREQMNLFRFFVSEVGGVSEVQEALQGYAVPVTVAYMAEEAWQLQPYAPRLKRIVFKATDLLSY